MMAGASVNFTEIEKEVIYLKAIAEMIDATVNYEVFDLLGEDPNSQILFRTRTHQQYFNIILVDFLSHSDSKVVGEKRHYLEVAQEICQNSNFDANDSISSLTWAVNEFNEWLEHEIQVQIWIPSMNNNMVLSIKRREFIKICGNISKHNFSRLGSVGRELAKIFERNGVNANIHDALLALYDFYEHFQDNILNYHGSTIAEFLNNIRWGIHEYLQPEFSQSIAYTGGHPLGYRYTYPAGVENGFAKKCYSDLMDTVRCAPIVRRFVVTSVLKSRY
jgi:hypothetical protein